MKRFSLLCLFLLITSLSVPTMSRAADDPWQPAAPSGTSLLRRTYTPANLPNEGRLPPLEGVTEWINSPPLTAAGLRGKVVLVDFWTYTCINWLRTLPYTRAWADKYKDQGLVVIGVHTPEFDFEHRIDNVRRAAMDLDVSFPIAIDNAQRIWDAFDNQYWPALYIIDAQGRIRHHQFGEGDYEQSERVIQQLLAEAGSTSTERTLVSLVGQGVEAPADLPHLRSPETYVGSGRRERFVSRALETAGTSPMFVLPAKLTLNDWGLSGDWTVKKQFAVLMRGNGRIAYRFHSRDVHLVMGPAAGTGVVRFRVLVDGKPPLNDHGLDVDAQGNGKVTAQRLYQLIRQDRPVADRLFEIEFLDPGIEAFAFTFG